MLSQEEILKYRIRPLLVLFVVGLVLSGATAIPLESELDLLGDLLKVDDASAAGDMSGLQIWIERVRDGLSETYERYPFIAYGTDWLAFGHFMIALVFVGAIIDPWKNDWVITFGMIACAAVVPMALIAGPCRGIPFWWLMIDCSFGLFGILPLWAARWYVNKGSRLETEQKKDAAE